MYTKELPYSIETEQALLGSIIIDNEIYNKLTINEGDFYLDRHKIIFKVIKSLIDFGKCVDLVMVRDFITAKKIGEEVGGIGYIIEIIESCTNSIFWESYDKTIKEHSHRRKIILESRKLEKIGYDEDIKDVYSRIGDLQTGLEIKQKKGNTIIELCDSFEKFLDDYKNRGGLGYGSPYPIIDKYTGGIIPGKVYTIVAYSGVGKSNFSYSYITDNLKKEKKVLVFSLEVQKEMLFNSLLKSYYNINQKKIIKGYDYEIGDFQNLKIYDDVYKLEEIKAIVKSEKSDIVYIDFIQNVQTKGNSEYEQMTKIAQELQQLAITTNTTIFNISQANNDSRFKDSSKIQPKGSGAIFASSDVIFALSRDGKNLQMNLIKNKYGMSDKTFLLIPDFSKLQFDISKELQDIDIQEEKTDFSL